MLLESSAVMVRADDLKTSVAFADITGIGVRDGWLELRVGRERTRLHLGAEATRWAERIRNPPSLPTKLGIKPGTSVTFMGGVDPDLREQVEAGGGRVVRRRPPADVVVLAAATLADLDTLHDLRAEMRDDAAVWVMWRKGRRELTENHVRSAALEARLVDVKVASVSDVWSGLKLVIRRAERGGSTR